MAYIVIFILGIFLGALANANFRGKVVAFIRRLSKVTREETKHKGHKKHRKEE